MTWVGMGDLHEIFVGKMGLVVGNNLYYLSILESDVIPENVDAIRALIGTESDWRVSVETDPTIASMLNEPWGSAGACSSTHAHSTYL